LLLLHLLMLLLLVLLLLTLLQVLEKRMNSIEEHSKQVGDERTFLATVICSSLSPLALTHARAPAGPVPHRQQVRAFAIGGRQLRAPPPALARCHPRAVSVTAMYVKRPLINFKYSCHAVQLRRGANAVVSVLLGLGLREAAAQTLHRHTI